MNIYLFIIIAIENIILIGVNANKYDESEYSWIS